MFFALSGTCAHPGLHFPKWCINYVSIAEGHNWMTFCQSADVEQTPGTACVPTGLGNSEIQSIMISSIRIPRGF